MNQLPVRNPSELLPIKSMMVPVDISDQAVVKNQGAEKVFVTLLGNRGCRAHCAFGTVRDFNGFGGRQRPVESLADEIDFLARKI